MPVVQWRDRVLETTTTEGLGNILLAGALPGFQSFSTAYGADTNDLDVAIVEDSGAWETLRCNYKHASQTLEIVTFLASSTGSKINWASGTRKVYVAMASASGPMARRENLAGLPNLSEARTNLGATATGAALFTAANAAAGRTALGGTTVGGNVFTAADAAAARTALGLGTAAQRNVGTGADQIPDVEDADARFEKRFPSGTELIFGTAPPSGWTRVNDADAGGDVFLKAARSGETAGAVGGTAWASHVTSGHALDESEIPSHTHPSGGGTHYVTFAATGSNAFAAGSNNIGIAAQSGSAGGGGAHSHSLPSTQRPRFRVAVRATKD